MSLYSLPFDLTTQILSHLNCIDFKKYFMLSKEINTGASSIKDTWLSRFDKRFNVQLSGQEIYSLLENLLESQCMINAPIYLLKGDTIKLLGHILLSPGDKLHNLLAKIINRFGIYDRISYYIISDDYQSIMLKKSCQLIDGETKRSDIYLKVFKRSIASYNDNDDDDDDAPGISELSEILIYSLSKTFKPPTDNPKSKVSYDRKFSHLVKWLTHPLCNIIPGTFPKGFSIVLYGDVTVDDFHQKIMIEALSESKKCGTTTDLISGS